MVKWNEITNTRKKEIIKKLIEENISKQWLRNILLQKTLKSNDFGGHHIDLSLADVFDRFIWDNLTEEQQRKVIESLNLIIEEDLFKEKAWEDNYCFHLLDFAIVLNQKLPGKINTKPFIFWKEQNFPNLAPPPVHPDEPVIKNLILKIESAFGKK